MARYPAFTEHTLEATQEPVNLLFHSALAHYAWGKPARVHSDNDMQHWIHVKARGQTARSVNRGQSVGAMGLLQRSNQAQAPKLTSFW